LRVKARFFASHSEIVGRREMEVELSEGATVSDLLEMLRAEYQGLSGLSFLLAVNRQYVGLETRLREGDEVALIPPISGGCPAAEAGMYRVTGEELDIPATIASVQHPGAGAVVSFIGTVREVSQGRKVLHLEYDAYPEMAEAKLAEIGREIAERWGTDRVAIVHRVGRLEVGEAAVVIAVATPHRAQGFAACRYAIDRIKEIVPIWKKEVWEGDEAWVELG
jgi:molybdopterin synthase catalytic subunit